jgi:hypothetical protein
MDISVFIFTDIHIHWDKIGFTGEEVGAEGSKFWDHRLPVVACLGLNEKFGQYSSIQRFARLDLRGRINGLIIYEFHLIYYHSFGFQNAVGKALKMFVELQYALSPVDEHIYGHGHRFSRNLVELLPMLLAFTSKKFSSKFERGWVL